MPRKKPGTDPKPKEIEIPHRHPGGHVAATEKSEPIAPTLLKRLKDEVLPKAKDKRLGTVLGLLNLAGIITEAEAEAGFLYAEDVGAFDRINGAPIRHERSPSYEGGFKGGGGVDLDVLRKMDPEAADKLERKIKRRNNSIRKRYDAAQAVIPQFPIIISTIVEEVCCNDRSINQVHLGSLKRILRNLAIHYKLKVDAEARQRPSKRADAVLIAQGAVDALEQWFVRRKGEVIGYRLASVNRTTRRVVTPTITAYGTSKLKPGELLEHTIRLKRSGLMIEEINAQLVKAAEEKGWDPANRPETKEVA